ncbi:MAG TPA: tetratricopeptide repeat protein [Dongiaceae bacterium]|nr:tetratricopeptide repeat protein [Dongiaceae bacterium]
MDVYTTEEQQVEAIKKWWKTNGNSVLIGITVAIVAVFGWQLFHQNNRANGESAAALYTELQESATLVQQDRMEKKTAELEGHLATFNHLATQLKEDFAKTEYAVFAALLLAREKVQTEKLDEALTELKWANENAKSDALRLVANLRLARVLAAKGDREAALKQLDSVQPGAQADSYEEVRGDIYVQLGDAAKARDAYKKAMDLSAAKGNGTSRPILKIKHDNLLVADK